MVVDWGRIRRLSGENDVELVDCIDTRTDPRASSTIHLRVVFLTRAARRAFDTLRADDQHLIYHEISDTSAVTRPSVRE
jgi:hypothetical protein